MARGRPVFRGAPRTIFTLSSAVVEARPGDMVE
jgi:hypothetical protein